MKTIKIEKLVFGGQGLGFLDGKACFVWNALPGEEAEIEIIKNKKTHLEAMATKIIKSSSDRIEPKEDHFLSCSPWQIMNFAAENRWKKDIAVETYRKLGGFDVCDLEIVSDGKEYGYRNKMEYSFTGKDGAVSLAFHVRESRQYVRISVCELAMQEINDVALQLLAWVNQNQIPIRSLKTMIVRCNQKGEILAGLFLKDRLQFEHYPELKNNLVGLTVFYSTHKSPASVPTDVLYQTGQDCLDEDLLGTKLKYGLFSFFQINIPVFKKALNDIKKFIFEIEGTGRDLSVLDFYSGVGSISLPLAKKFKDCVLVDSNEEAIGWAKENIEMLAMRDLTLSLSYEERGLKTAMCMPAEKMTELVTSDKVVIVDPPRAGLDKRVVERILAVKPKQVIYLSCNLSTHARDLGLLKEAYDIKFMKLYNFFPRTAHIEGLAVLARR
ncbi:MAG: 23S rRNA (uracil(1939)-C(5))-methyltransferase RlmD [Candidatus Magasanikbacteria bacterium]|nr:23S rRNA (uracil(1939)-C(5))-methyltransferase RlmD [Candidatus Magasanikbacteria bacterium]